MGNKRKDWNVYITTSGDRINKHALRKREL